MYIDPNKTIIVIGHKHYQCGISKKRFNFDPYDPESRRNAHQDCLKHSQGCYVAAEKRAGKPLSGREVIHYKGDPDPRKASPDDNVRREYAMENIELTPHPGEPTNPYRIMLSKDDSLFGSHQDQKYSPQFRARIERDAKAWDDQKAAAAAQAKADKDPVRLRAISLAESQLTSALRMGNIPPARVEELKEQLTLAKNDPQEYWKTITAEDAAREQEEEESKKAAIKEAKEVLARAEISGQATDDVSRSPSDDS